MTWPDAIFLSVLVLTVFPSLAWGLICTIALGQNGEIPRGLLPFNRKDKR